MRIERKDDARPYAADGLPIFYHDDDAQRAELSSAYDGIIELADQHTNRAARGTALRIQR